MAELPYSEKSNSAVGDEMVRVLVNPSWLPRNHQLLRPAARIPHLDGQELVMVFLDLV